MTKTKGQVTDHPLLKSFIMQVLVKTTTTMSLLSIHQFARHTHESQSNQIKLNSTILQPTNKSCQSIKWTAISKPGTIGTMTSLGVGMFFKYLITTKPITRVKTQRMKSINKIWAIMPTITSTSATQVPPWVSVVKTIDRDFLAAEVDKVVRVEQMLLKMPSIEEPPLKTTSSSQCNKQLETPRLTWDKPSKNRISIVWRKNRSMTDVVASSLFS